MKYAKFVVTAIICILFFILGMKISDLRDDAISDGYKKISEYGNIKVYYREGYYEENAELYLNDLKSLPEELKENCERIFFTNENLNEKFDTGIETKIVAISLGKDIYISTDYYEIGVLVHELYHVYDYANGWISDTDEFKELYEEYKNKYEVSPGNAQNCYEFFASYGENFYLRKDYLDDDTLFAYFCNLGI